MKGSQKRPWFKVWPKDIPKTIKYPDIPLYRLLKDSAKKYPNKLAIDHGKEQIPYKKLDALSDNFAAALKDLNVKKGNSVLIFLPNIPEFVISYYAVLKVGGVVAPANPLSKEMELEYALNNSNSETIIAHESLYPIVKNAQRGTALKNAIVVGEKRYQSTYLLRDLMTKYPSQPFEVEIRPKQDVAAIQSTGILNRS